MQSVRVMYCSEWDLNSYPWVGWDLGDCTVIYFTTWPEEHFYQMMKFNFLLEVEVHSLRCSLL